MKLTGNTILITGGGSGIGRGLAREFFKLGNKVIVAGRRMGALEETVAELPGAVARQLDLNDARAVAEFGAGIVEEFPELNVLVNNAGIMRAEDLTKLPGGLADSEAVVTTNLLGPIRLTAALMPHLQGRERSAIINVSSGLAFVPFPVTPTYSATKAALHSYTVSLRVQLAEGPVEVIEIIPPAVATDLTPGRTTEDPRMMGLDEFIAETMAILKREPTPQEICVERVKFLRYAEANGEFGKALEMLSKVKLAK